MSNGKCKVLSLLPSSYHESIPFHIELGFQSSDESAEQWNQHAGAIRKSMARNLLLNFNADAEDDCPFLSLGEHDITIDKVDQKDTSSAVVHASVAFWGPTGNVVATRCSKSMYKSIDSAIASGRLAQSVQESADLGGVPHVTIQDTVQGTASTITTSVIAACKNWCAANKKEWNKKCTWLGICDGCNECSGLVSTTNTITSTSPSTESNTAACKQWCATNKKEWNKKCTWEGICDGCNECLVPSPTSATPTRVSQTTRVPITTPSTPTATTAGPACKNWCAANKKEWNNKCTWLGLCNGCNECSGVSTTNTVTSTFPSTKSNTAACKQWCATNKQAWKKKCTWLGSCDGCDECGVMQTTRASPSATSKAPVSTTSPVTASASTRNTPSSFLQCKKWCATNKKAWKNKCTWLGICDGCDECREAMGVQGHKTQVEVSKITGCKTKNLAGSRDCEQHHSQNQISDDVTNLSTYARLSDFVLMLVGFSALVF